MIGIGTVSKSLAPALRIGWILCPPALADLIAEEKDLNDRGSPTIEQHALARLIESGRYDRHLRRMRAVYAARRTVVTEALAEHAPDVRLTGLTAGFHAVAHLDDTADEHAVTCAARARSVGLYGISRCRSDHARTPPRLVLGFGDLSETAIRAGSAAVGDLLR